MKHVLLAALLVLPPVAYSQAIPFEQGPEVSITASGSYIYGEPWNNQNHSLWGGSLTPEINITRRIGFQADFGYYSERIAPEQHRLFMTAGPRYNFPPVHKVRPFAFAEGGEVRLTWHGTALRDWDPVIKTGVGFEYHMLRNVSFTMVPAEYIAHNNDYGGWSHDYTARAGITVNLYAKPREKKGQ